jgi:hypothetical protein
MASVLIFNLRSLFFLKLKPDYPFDEGTAIRSYLLNFGNPAIPKAWNSCLHAVGGHFGLETLPHDVSRFGTLARRSASALRHAGVVFDPPVTRSLASSADSV